MNKSSVSVIITCYNQARFLDEAIDSVLTQSCAPDEILVLDDGSKDNTAEVLARYTDIRYIRQENQGVVAARNRGLRESKGEYLVFLDGDDRLMPDALAAGLRSLQSNTECGLTFGTCRQITADGSPLPYTSFALSTKDIYAALLRRNDIWMPAQVMYRRATLEAVGGFDPKFDHGSDYELYLRITRELPAVNHNNVVAEWRQHDTNTTRDAERMLKAAVSVHRSQRAFIKVNRRYEQAYREGAREVEEYFGERVVGNILTHVRAGGDRKQAVKSAMVLLRYAPDLFFKHVRRKLHNTIFGVGNAS